MGTIAPVGTSTVTSRIYPDGRIAIVAAVNPLRWRAQVSLGGVSGTQVLAITTPHGAEMRPGRRRSVVEQIAITEAESAAADERWALDDELKRWRQ